ncbi:A/G-specific adenine glycosylase [Balneolaceae bacterium ANBcel3]|nr:A/G-specific adenine glycosylase [Balneolaceae bacterium ANBcel3]
MPKKKTVVHHEKQQRRVQKEIPRLLSWFHRNKREMPWRNTRDPYLIWLSEIMLQQTRVDQARPYFDRFAKRFPNIRTLAEAPLDDVLLHWEGLGYYSRARNLHKAAKQLAEKYDHTFPEEYEEVLSLPGVGPYTAAAVMSIAMSKPYAVVDGNVIRVISRLFAIDTDTRKSATWTRINELASALMEEHEPGDFNQALMELGASVCAPNNPDCGHCPFQNVCMAHQDDRTRDIPYKSPAKKKPHYPIAVAVIIDQENRILICRRPEEKMLGGLWEFPGGKVEAGEAPDAAAQREALEEVGLHISAEPSPFLTLKHTYSHFSITLSAFFARCTSPEQRPVSKNGEPQKWVDKRQLGNFAFPKANKRITDYLLKHPLPCPEKIK